MCPQGVKRTTFLHAVHVQHLPENVVHFLITVVHYQVFLPYHHTGEVHLIRLPDKGTHIFFRNRTAGYHLFTNETICAIYRDVSIYQFTDFLKIINEGERTSGGNEHFDAQLLRLPDGLYRRIRYPVGLKADQSAVNVKKQCFYHSLTYIQNDNCDKDTKAKVLHDHVFT